MSNIAELQISAFYSFLMWGVISPIGTRIERFLIILPRRWLIMFCFQNAEPKWGFHQICNKHFARNIFCNCVMHNNSKHIQFLTMGMLQSHLSIVTCNLKIKVCNKKLRCHLRPQCDIKVNLKFATSRVIVSTYYQ